MAIYCHYTQRRHTHHRFIVSFQQPDWWLHCLLDETEGGYPHNASALPLPSLGETPMQIIKIEDIIIGARQRKTFDKENIHELAESIANIGLLHPIVCSRKDDGKIHLVAGERRLRAIKFLGLRRWQHGGNYIEPGCVPSTLLERSDEISLRVAELDENWQRVDLSWQERTAALDELHTLRTMQNPEQSIQDTAKEISETNDIPITTARERVHRAVLIQDHMDDPNVSRAKTESKAYEHILRTMESDLLGELSKRNITSVRKHTVIHGDAVIELGKMEAEYNLVLCDPPYGINANAFGNAASNAHIYSDSEEDALELVEQILYRSFQLTKPEAHIYLFCDIEHFRAIRDIAGKVGWKPWRTPIIWHKTLSSAHAPAHEHGFRRNYEIALFATKGNKPFSQVYSDVLSFPQAQNKIHAAQKPIDLYAELIKRSTMPGDKVLDPCCGSGTIFAAAERNGVIATGIELEEKFYKHCLLAIDNLAAGISSEDAGEAGNEASQQVSGTSLSDF